MKPNVDSSLRRSYGLATTLVAAIQTLVASAPVATAGLPEPDTVFFGTIAIDNAFVTAAESQVTVELRRTPDGPPLTTSALRQLEKAKKELVYSQCVVKIR